MISFLVLFVHFYVQTYWKPKKSPNANNGHCIVSSGSETITDKDKIPQSAYSDDEDFDLGAGKMTNGLKIICTNGRIALEHDDTDGKTSCLRDSDEEGPSWEEDDSQYTDDDNDLTSDESLDLDNEDKDSTTKVCSAAVSAVVASSTSCRLSTEGNDTLVLN